MPKDRDGLKKPPKRRRRGPLTEERTGRLVNLIIAWQNVRHQPLPKNLLEILEGTDPASIRLRNSLVRFTGSSVSELKRLLESKPVTASADQGK